MWDNFLLKYSLWGIQSPNCNQKKNYTEFHFKAFRSENKLHNNPGLH